MTQPAELSPALVAVLETHEKTPSEPNTRPADPAASEPVAEATAPPKASHDNEPPAALIAFMVQGWRPPTGDLPQPIEHHEAFARRRRALSERFPGETLIVPAGHLKVRSNDTHYPFRPSSDFYYLTGNSEPDCVLVLEPRASGGHTAILFVEPNPGRSDPSFFTDRVKGELWVGARLGVRESRARFGVDECRALGDLSAYVASLGDRSARASRITRGFSGALDAALAQHDRDGELSTTLAEMRLIKDDIEIEELRAVIDATKRGFEDVIERIPHARTEREVEGVFNLRARMEGNDVGYGTIAASGHHACTLHYTRNDGVLSRDDLLLLDGGIEGNSFYTADITRTLPLSGRFSEAQRRIYKLVFAAQKAAFAKVAPGNDFMDPNRAAMRVLAEGLHELGLLGTSVDEALKDENQFYKRYSLHNVSHMLGLDVHDCAAARQEAYKHGKLKPGMVLTVEPGLYFQADDLTVPEEYRGIGVRIEDDLLVTEGGYENLSAHIPSKLRDVERWMSSVWKNRKKRR
jgi:Xaa-Pro aminopeptidase